jgi:hypothetical protein
MNRDLSLELKLKNKKSLLGKKIAQTHKTVNKVEISKDLFSIFKCSDVEPFDNYAF